MEYILLFVIIIMLIDLESKISKNNSNMKKKIDLEQLKNLIGKKVCINIDNDDIENSYLFNPISNTEGFIREFDDEWLLFEYSKKNEIVSQYFRIKDIVSIDELK